MTTEQDVLKAFKLPFWYDGKRAIFDANDVLILEMSVWPYLRKPNGLNMSYQEGNETGDKLGEMIATAFNEKYSKIK